MPQGLVPSGAGRGMPSAAAAGLNVAVPGISTSVGGRSSFTTNPYSAHLAGRSRTAGAPPKDDDEAVDTKLVQLAQDTSHKRHHKGDDREEEDEGADETKGSDIEDMTAASVSEGQGSAKPR